MPACIRVVLGAMVAVLLAGCRTPTTESHDPADAWGPVEHGLRVQLREIPNSYARGYLKLLCLSLENVSDKTIRYDSQQADCNGSLVVKRNGTVPVPFRGENVSTVGEIKTLDPGAIAPLFYGLILEEQYDISRPGTYTVQFRGLNGHGEAVPIPASNIITIRMQD